MTQRHLDSHISSPKPMLHPQLQQRAGMAQQSCSKKSQKSQMGLLLASSQAVWEGFC